MPQRALYDALPDFGAAPVRLALAAAPPLQQPNAPPDLDAIVAAEVARAERDVAERLAAVHEARIEAERQRHRAELEDLERRLGTAAGEAISAAFSAAEEGARSALAAPVARMLAGLMSDELARRSVEALGDAVREAMGGGDALRISVAGPASMLEAVAGVLGERAASARLREAPGFDVSVTLDARLFETRIAEWSATVAEIVA